MRRTYEKLVCDVCQKDAFSEEKLYEIEFKRDGEPFVFDACMSCLTVGGIRGVYRKITELLRECFKC